MITELEELEEAVCKRLGIPQMGLSLGSQLGVYSIRVARDDAPIFEACVRRIEEWAKALKYHVEHEEILPDEQARIIAEAGGERVVEVDFDGVEVRLL